MSEKTYSIVINDKDELLKFLSLCYKNDITVDTRSTFCYALNNQFGLRFVKRKKNFLSLWDSEASYGGRNNEGYIDYSIHNINSFLNIVKQEAMLWNDLKINDVFQWEGDDNIFIKISNNAYITNDGWVNDNYIGIEQNNKVIKLNKRPKISFT